MHHVLEGYMKVRNRMEEKNSLSFWSDCILLAKYDMCQKLLCWPRRHQLIDVLERSAYASHCATAITL